MPPESSSQVMQQVMLTICPHRLDGRPVVNVHTDDLPQGTLADFQQILRRGFRVADWESMIPDGVASDGRCHLLFTLHKTEGEPECSQEILILGTYLRQIDGMTGVSVIGHNFEDATLESLNRIRSQQVLLRREHFGASDANAYGYTIHLFGGVVASPLEPAVSGV